MSDRLEIYLKEEIEFRKMSPDQKNILVEEEPELEYELSNFNINFYGTDLGNLGEELHPFRKKEKYLLTLTSADGDPIYSLVSYDEAKKAVSLLNEELADPEVSLRINEGSNLL